MRQDVPDVLLFMGVYSFSVQIMLTLPTLTYELVLLGVFCHSTYQIVVQQHAIPLLLVVFL